MKEAILLVDYSYDFVADDGALTCGKAGQALDGPICQRIDRMLERGGFLIVCNDQHDPGDPYDPEAGLFPPHNIAGSPGAAIFGQTGRLVTKLLTEQPGRCLYLPKGRYSAFRGTPLDELLRQRQVERLEVMGVCTDICVLHTVIDAIYAHYQVAVPADCCATIMPHGQEWALAHMKNCLGVEIL